MYGALWNWNVSNVKINIRDESIVEFFIIIVIIFFFIKNKYFDIRVIFYLYLLKMIIFIIYNKDKILYFRYRIQILYNNTKNSVQFFFI